ncbi:hypothetical protein [Klebsiella variicola]|uniref:hypothetical protein n=1 Tax=Klebsiella variicola TaxID=244366 RepID=UPI000C7A7ECB|nr:hypothetical protein [Klebsiella variicola]PLK33715.1 hypothetical protein CYD38_14525 [Klebsiella variicola]REI48978.1 hypothetical protein DY002_16605 [Klebsiella variicola]REI53889.1 hypothetical protein DYB09_10615 [Klebsiella variicola]REI58002.1 hypothetical protein DYB19_06450 [Klebsiella variicola]REI63911.1 hypothetical protein DY007_15455 [Klebsiella variicola]
MTDITELAQSLKAAAVRVIKNYDSEWFEAGHQICTVHKSKINLISLANPVNVLALAEALEKAQQRITQMESRTVTDWIEHDGKWRPESLGLDELVYLKTRKQELKIPYPAGKVKGWMNTGGDMDVMAYKLASPQASTVTVKLASRRLPSDYVDGEFGNDDLAAIHNACLLECKVSVEKYLSAHGIVVKWEDE